MAQFIKLFSGGLSEYSTETYINVDHIVAIEYCSHTPASTGVTQEHYCVFLAGQSEPIEVFKAGNESLLALIGH